MKKIFFILLLFPLTLSAQTYFPVDNLNVKNILRVGSWYIVKNNDSIWIEKPLGVFQNRIDTTRSSGGGSGSPVYAGIGLFKDEDTIKLDYDQQLEGGSIIGYEEVVNGETRSANILSTKDIVNEKPKLVLSATGKIDSNNLFLELDSATFKFLNLDTTLTEPNSVMTEAQTKREINAADGGWRKRADATKYVGALDSLVIIDEGAETAENGVHFYYQGDISFRLNQQSFKLFGTSKNSEMSLQGLYNSPAYVCSANDIASFNYAPTITQMGIYISNADTIKFGRNFEGIGQGGDYFYSTKSGSIGIVSNGAKTYEVDSVGHVSFKGTYASIYRARSLGDTTQSIPNGTIPTKVLAFSTNGNASNCTPDKTNDKITVTKKGRYLANLSISYASGSATVNWTAYVFVNGVESDNIHSTGYTATANDKRSTSTSGIIDVQTVPCDVDYRVTHSSGASVNLIFSYVNLSLTYIGD